MLAQKRVGKGRLNSSLWREEGFGPWAFTLQFLLCSSINLRSEFALLISQVLIIELVINLSSVIKGCIVFSLFTLGYLLLSVAFLELGETKVKVKPGSVSFLFFWALDWGIWRARGWSCCPCSVGDNLCFPCSQLMDRQLFLSSFCLFIGFCFLRQEAGLELPTSEDDLELLSLLFPLPNVAIIGTGSLCSACPELLAALLFPVWT